MATRSSQTGRETRLIGRRHECARLDDLLTDVRNGVSRSVLLLGEAGIGKTALLERVVASATDMTAVRAVGVESEMELPFASLHELCAPLLDYRAGLPDPQRQALELVFGVTAGAPPDRFLVGLAILSLLSAAAETRPLLCVIDDAQWLDLASARTLAFVARRLLAEPVGVVFAARTQGDALAHVPTLEISGLHDEEATALLDSALGLKLDERVRSRLVAETQGNPLALLELPRGLTAAELALGFGPLGAHAPGRVEERFTQRLSKLSPGARRLLLLAAADPTGDRDLLIRAADHAGIEDIETLADETEQLLAIGTPVMFRHPLVRSAVYGFVSPEERRLAHRAIGDVTDPAADPDRRAWHLAAATQIPDDGIADELDRSAARAQARGGLAAAAAFLERSVELTQDPVRRVDRALTAVQVTHQAGDFDGARRVLVVAEGGPLTQLQRAQVELLRGEIAFGLGLGKDAVAAFTEAARQLETLDPKLACDACLEAWAAAEIVGRDGGHADVARRSRAALGATDSSRASDLLLDGLATLLISGRRAAAPKLRRAGEAFMDPATPTADLLRWGVMAPYAPCLLWDDELAYATFMRQAEFAREVGALGRLAFDLNALAAFMAWCGDFETAAALNGETAAVMEATGVRMAAYGVVWLAAFQGREAQARAVIDVTTQSTDSAGQGAWWQMATWLKAVLCNGLGLYDEALTAARQAADYLPELFLSAWALPELIEAAVRCHADKLANDGLGRLSEVAASTGTDWALGIEARCHALLSCGQEADGLYREAIERLGRTRLRPELARAHLVYGEWLRRDRRRVEAREQLRTADELFVAIGMEAFAARAGRELLATGETARKRTTETTDELTAQERQVARMARDGLSNPEIGARLFISPRTVEYHLRKVFMKLDIQSRRELPYALGRADSPVTRA